MLRIHDVVNVVSGTPQFRIAETLDPAAPVYKFYSQADLELDLKGFRLMRRQASRSERSTTSGCWQQGDRIQPHFRNGGGRTACS